MYISELQNKDVISLINGNNLGRIVDASIDDTGAVKEFIVEPRKFFIRLFKKEEVFVKYSNIVKIGEDVILIKDE